jgi:hypothetical protein
MSVADREFSKVIVGGDHDSLSLDCHADYDLVGSPAISIGDVDHVVARLTQRFRD